MINSDQQTEENKELLQSQITTTNIENSKHAQDTQGVAGDEAS